MLLRHLAAAVLALSGLSSVARAEVIGSAPLIAPGQIAVECLFSNLSGVSVTFNSVRIINSAGATKPASNTCVTPLAPDKVCNVSAKVPTVGAHFCKANVSGSAAGIRGEFYVIDNTGARVLNTPVR